MNKEEIIVTVLEETISRISAFADNIVRTELSCLWETYGVRQTLRVEITEDREISGLARIHIETEFISDLSSREKASAVSSFSIIPTVLSGLTEGRDGRSLVLKSIVLLGSDNRETAPDLLARCAGAQALDTLSYSAFISRRSGGTPAVTRIPPSTRFEDPEGKIRPIFTPADPPIGGWRDESLRPGLEKLLAGHSVEFNIDTINLTAELPFGQNPGPLTGGKTSSLLQAFIEENIMGLGPGLSFVLTFPFHINEKGRSEIALEFNGLEHQYYYFSHFLGSWGSDFLSCPAYRNHIPGAFSDLDDIPVLFRSMINRAVWIDQMLIDIF